jgi:acetyl-CoA carboxylase biotin carboxyl carrier protein
MADHDFDLPAIERLIKLVEARALTELVVEEGGVKVTIRGADYAKRQAAPVAPKADTQHHDHTISTIYDESATSDSRDEEVEDESDRIAVASPMVGVFYRSSGPDAAAYVEIGDRVEVGQIIGLIEAMKVFSEVPSEAAGTVVAIAVSNGQLVRSGDPLVYLRAD